MLYIVTVENNYFSSSLWMVSFRLSLLQLQLQICLFLLFLIYSALAPRVFQFCFFSKEAEEKQWLQGFSGPWLWNGHKWFVQLVMRLGTAEKLTHLIWIIRTSANLHSIYNLLRCILHRPCPSVLVKPYLKSYGLSGPFKWLMELWVFHKYKS